MLYQTKDDIRVPPRYKHIVEGWELEKILKLDTDFCLNKRIYQIFSPSLHGLRLFSMDGIKVKYGGVNELMEYAMPCYRYGVYIILE